jgi:2'-5' RNA ligase
MHGLVSLLDSQHYHLVEEIWRELERDCGLTGIQVTPFPHISWKIAADYDFEALKGVVQEIAAETMPFTITVNGLGIFTNEAPVVYLSVVRTAPLSVLHAKIWARVLPISTDVSPYYAPEQWMPHISLAYTDVTCENLPCVLEKIAFRPFSWQVGVDNIAFIHEPNGEIGEKWFEYNLGPKE